MIGFLKNLRRSAALRSAARLCARQLGPRMARDYGGSEFNTEGQIRTAAEMCRLRQEFFYLAFAAFLREAEFVHVMPERDYRSARETVRRYRDSADGTPWEPLATDSGAFAAAGQDNGHSV